jgi:hypothetical protein
VRTAYGAEMDAAGYLRRFIDIDYNMPPPNTRAFVAAQFERYGLVDAFKKRNEAIRQNDIGDFREVFSGMSDALEFTPRDLERAFTLLALSLNTTAPNVLLFPWLLGPLILLKIKQHDLYFSFVRRRIGPEAVMARLAETPSGKKFVESRAGIITELYLVASISQDRDEALSIYRAMYPNENEPRIAEISGQLRQMGFREHGFGVLDYAASKIDLVADFERP